MIGINDIWRAFVPGREAEAVPIDEYERTLRALLRRAVDATGCRLVLADPFLIEADVDEPQRAETDRYARRGRRRRQGLRRGARAHPGRLDRVLRHSPSTPLGRRPGPPGPARSRRHRRRLPDRPGRDLRP